MRLLLSGMLIWLILSTALRDVLVLTAFQLNQEYIANNLCLDRGLEDNMCHGTCQLKIELEKNHDQQNTRGFTLLSDQLPITFFFQSNDQSASLTIDIQSLSPVGFQTVYFSKFLFRILRPPQVC